MIEHISKEENEASKLLVEEFAEVIICLSKVSRFGKYSIHNGIKNLDHLETEIGDVLALLDILEEIGYTSKENIHQAKLKKLEKLKEWSLYLKPSILSIYNKNINKIE